MGAQRLVDDAGHGLDPGTIRESPDTFKLEAYNGRTGKQFDTSYGGRTPLTVELTKDKSLAGFIKVLKGQRVGTRLLAAIPPIDGFGTARPEVGLNQSDTMVFYLDILAKVGTVAAAGSALQPWFTAAGRTAMCATGLTLGRRRARRPPVQRVPAPAQPVLEFIQITDTHVVDLTVVHPALAKALRVAWQLPARSLAFRNVEHQKEIKKAE